MYRKYTTDINPSDVNVFIKGRNTKVDVSVPTSPDANIDVGVGTNYGGDKFYKHIQQIASTIWEVKHDLNKFPSVTVVDDEKNIVFGGVQYIDKNNVVLTFTIPFAGEAYFN